MGCTSSAPNMVTPKSNTAEKSIQFEGKISDGDSNDVEEIIYRAEDNDKSVLPSCDNLTDNIVKNKSTSSLLSEKDHDSTNLIDNKTDATTAHPNEKIPKLEEVVVKVVQLNNIENVDETHGVDLKTEGDQNSEEGNRNETIEEHCKNELTVNTGNESDKQQRVENTTEAISPSQSESSRATRWEALADIAAELPATLAVDPITGQIYALSK